MFITIINDCKSYDEIGRQETRLAALFPNVHISFFGVSSKLDRNATLEAAGGLIDVLDAAEGSEGIVLLNSAPRGDIKEDGHNGTPFAHFHYKDTLVISTLKGQALSMVKKLKLVESIELMSVDEVMDYAWQHKLLSLNIAEYVKTTQFRSFDFVPRVAKWLHDGETIPSKTLLIDQIEDAPSAIWYIDAFGNCKTTLTKQDLNVDPGGNVKTNIGTFRLYPRLKDLPKKETAMYFGSSGIESTRLVEIATQQGSAAIDLGVKQGQYIELKID